MGKRRFQVGSIAVLFSVVMLCVSVFSLLTVVTAASDARVARQYADHVRELYRCEDLGQCWLAGMDGYLSGKEPLPAGTRLSGDLAETEITEGNRTLRIRLLLKETDYEICLWNCTARWSPEENWELWPGTGE